MIGGDVRTVSEAARLEQKSVEAFGTALEATSSEEQEAALDTALKAARDSAFASAYVFLQRLVGSIAIALPFVLAVGNMLFNGFELRPSISAYYYTPLGNVFVGALCALGVFFFSYQYKPLDGYERDNKLSYGASAAAIGVAVLPTAEHQAEAWTGEWYVSTGHLVCASILFLLLAYFSLFLFTKSDPKRPMSAAKRKQNRVFRICGWVIVASIVLVGLSNIVDPPAWWKSLFFLESAGVIAFGVSWLVKSGIVRSLAVRAPVVPPPSDEIFDEVASLLVERPVEG